MFCSSNHNKTSNSNRFPTSTFLIDGTIQLTRTSRNIRIWLGWTSRFFLWGIHEVVESKSHPQSSTTIPHWNAYFLLIHTIGYISHLHTLKKVNVNQLVVFWLVVWIPNGSRYSRDCYVGVSLGIPNQWAPCNRPSKGELEFPCLDQKSLEPEGGEGCEVLW